MLKNPGAYSYLVWKMSSQNQNQDQKVQILKITLSKYRILVNYGNHEVVKPRLCRNGQCYYAIPEGMYIMISIIPELNSVFIEKVHIYAKGKHVYINPIHRIITTPDKLTQVVPLVLQEKFGFPETEIKVVMRELFRR